jgi:hypothetical protein
MTSLVTLTRDVLWNSRHGSWLIGFKGIGGKDMDRAYTGNTSAKIYCSVVWRDGVGEV